MDKSILAEIVEEGGVNPLSQGLMRGISLQDVTQIQINVSRFSPVEIQRIRETCNASHADFACYLNTCESTVRKWESGQKKPSGPSLKLLNIVNRKGLQGLLY